MNDDFYVQRIHDLVQKLNETLNAAAGDGQSITIYVLPSGAPDQDNPTIGIRLGRTHEVVSEDLVWVGMEVPHAEE